MCSQTFCMCPLCLLFVSPFMHTYKSVWRPASTFSTSSTSPARQLHSIANLRHNRLHPHHVCSCCIHASKICLFFRFDCFQRGSQCQTPQKMLSRPLELSSVWLLLQDKGSGKGSLGCKLWPLDKHVEFDHQHAWDKSEAPSAPTLKPKDVKYNVKVCCQIWWLLCCWSLLVYQHPDPCTGLCSPHQPWFFWVFF